MDKSFSKVMNQYFKALCIILQTTHKICELSDMDDVIIQKQ